MVRGENAKKSQKDAMSTKQPGPSTGRRQPKLPGLRMAATAFVLTVLLGAGGIALANWNQSAITTIDVTAGAVPTPSPSPDPVPTPVPAPAPGNIVANPVITALPEKIDAATIACISPGNSGNFTFNWTGRQTAGTSYVVSLKSQTSSLAFQQSQTVTQATANFSLENKAAAYGNYLLRIQAVSTSTGIAGDPSYRTLRYFGKDNTGCDYGTSDGQPPLGALSMRAEPVAPRPNDNLLKISWTASAATSYVVTVVLPGPVPAYGAEFTTSALGATLAFPARSWNQAGTSVADAAYFGQYSLRILPMNGTQAGDPIYKTVQYGPYDLTVW